jgi:hypothetical protein
VEAELDVTSIMLAREQAKYEVRDFGACKDDI